MTPARSQIARTRSASAVTSSQFRTPNARPDENLVLALAIAAGEAECRLPAAGVCHSAGLLSGMTSRKSTPREHDEGMNLSPRSLEPVFASLLLLLAVLRAAFFGCAMVPSSLTHDELLSVTKYQAHGPLFAMTTYDEPNNHILFNALAALLPWRGSAMPVSARTIPMASVAALFAVLAICPWRRGRRFEGAFLVALFAFNPLLLGLWLSVRGYGLLALWAALAAFLAIEWERTAKLGLLAGLSAAIVLGTWTVPTFLLFGAPLLALVVLPRLSFRTLAAAGCCALAILAVHLPVLGAMHRALTSYGRDWGEDFRSASAVGALVRAAFGPVIGSTLTSFQTGIVCLVVAGVFLVARRKRPSEVRSVTPLFGAVVIFFGLCLALKSPVLRSTAFVVTPLAICVVLAAGEWIRGIPSASLRVAFAAIPTLPLLFLACRPVSFEPEEHWLKVAKTIESTFPAGTRIYSTPGPLAVPERRWGEFLHAEMRRPADFPSVTRFDPAAFEAGQLIVHERSYREHLAADELPAGCVRIRFAQMHLGYQALWLHPPATRGLRLPAGDILLETDRSVELVLESGRPLRSLVLVLAQAWSESPVRVWSDAGSLARDPAQYGRITIAYLGDSVLRTVALRAVEGSTPVRLTDAWVYPSGPD